MVLNIILSIAVVVLSCKTLPGGDNCGRTGYRRGVVAPADAAQLECPLLVL